MALVKKTPKELGSADDQLVIRIVEIISIDLGEPSKPGEQFTTYFPCKVKWIDSETPNHIIQLDFDSDLQKTDSIWIKSHTKGAVTPGLYFQVDSEKGWRPGTKLFEKIS